MLKKLISSLCFSMIFIPNLIGCSCVIMINELTYQEYFQYDFIANTKVIEEGKLYLKHDIQKKYGIYWAKVKVLEWYKGKTDLDTIWSDGGSCGRELKLGEEYIYYGSNELDRNYTGRCDRSKSRNDSMYGSYDQELAFLEIMIRPNWEIFPVKFSTGQIIGKGKFKDGKFHGYWEFFYPDGELRMKGQYENGLKVREWWERAYESYKSANDYSVRYTRTGHYENGQRIGRWLILTKSMGYIDEHSSYWDYKIK